MSRISTVRAVLAESPYLVFLYDDQGHSWQADEPTEFGGGASAPSPDLLLLGSLGACTAITLRMVAARRELPLEGVEVELQLNPDGKPEAGNLISRRIHLRGPLDVTQREQLLKAANACPIHRLLTGEVRIDTLLSS